MSDKLAGALTLLDGEEIVNQLGRLHLCPGEPAIPRLHLSCAPKVKTKPNRRIAEDGRAMGTSAQYSENLLWRHETASGTGPRPAAPAQSFIS